MERGLREAGAQPHVHPMVSNTLAAMSPVLFNIMFSIKDIANYSGYYFQICVKDMLLLFIDDTGKRKCNQQWLFEDCRHSIDAVKRYQELVLFDIKRLKEDCAQMIERAFAKDGVIAHCLSALNNNFPN